jgi:hypothetical protein
MMENGNISSLKGEVTVSSGSCELLRINEHHRAVLT